MIKILFECGGCDAKAEGWLKREFVSISGRSWGFGSYRETKAQEAAPEGWVAFDPYTGCTYCPECWESIENGPLDSAANDE